MPINPMIEAMLKQHAENMTQIHGEGLNSLIKISTLAATALADPHYMSGKELSDKINDIVDESMVDLKEDSEENDA